jgi:hypothetical protein
MAISISLPQISSSHRFYLQPGHPHPYPPSHFGWQKRVDVPHEELGDLSFYRDLILFGSESVRD